MAQALFLRVKRTDKQIAREQDKNGKAKNNSKPRNITDKENNNEYKG
jgi:hypothetical protein